VTTERIVRSAVHIAIACACALTTATASAHELFLQVDLRAVAVDSSLRSFTEGGLGLLRFDDDHE
jgi:hypothetical protein